MAPDEKCKSVIFYEENTLATTRQKRASDEEARQRFFLKRTLPLQPDEEKMPEDARGVKQGL